MQLFYHGIDESPIFAHPFGGIPSVQENLCSGSVLAWLPGFPSELRTTDQMYPNMLILYSVIAKWGARLGHPTYK